MVILLNFPPTASHETQATIDALPVGVERTVRQFARDAKLPQPAILWSGAAPDGTFDRILLRVRMVPMQGSTWLYDDAAPSALERVQRVTP